MKGTGAAAWRDALYEAGASVIFGYPGGAVLPLYEVLRTSRIRHVLVRHEAAAVHAAAGYALVSGACGVCLVTSGPGATNALTGIANAFMDSIPLVVFSGQVARGLIGTDAFQEVDIISAAQPFVKHSVSVRSAADMRGIVLEAFAIAGSGRPGPVLVDIPVDVAKALVKSEASALLRLGADKALPCVDADIAQAAALLRKSRRPGILAGGGVLRAGASDALFEMAQRLCAPVATTLMGLGAFPGSHPLCVGMLGDYGVISAREAMRQCDVVLALGVRMGDRATERFAGFASDVRVIHIDIDVAELDKNIQAVLAVAADLSHALPALLKYDLGSHQAWFHPAQTQEEEPLTLVMRALKDSAPDAVIATDVGLHQMAVARWYPFDKPNRLLTSGGLGTMGFGLPAAIGALTAGKAMKAEDGSRRGVVLVTGDGSLQMHLAELGTAMQEKLALKVVLINNHSLGMVAALEDQQWHGQHFAVSLKNPDFVQIARAYGLEATSVEIDAAQKGMAWLMRGKARLLEIRMDEQ